MTRMPEMMTHAEMREWANAATASPHPGFVYFIRFGTRIKVGFSTNPMRRLCEVPCEEILDLVPGCPSVEASFLRLLARSRIQGEWFIDSPRVRRVIREELHWYRKCPCACYQCDHALRRPGGEEKRRDPDLLLRTPPPYMTVDYAGLMPTKLIPDARSGPPAVPRWKTSPRRDDDPVDEPLFSLREPERPL